MFTHIVIGSAIQSTVFHQHATTDNKPSLAYAGRAATSELRVHTFMEPLDSPALQSNADPITDVRSYFETMDAGLKARALHDVYEEQQIRVIDMQREQREALGELAVAAVKARAALELGREPEADRLVAEVMEPLRVRLRQLTEDVAEANKFLEAYQAIGQGMV